MKSEKRTGERMKVSSGMKMNDFNTVNNSCIIPSAYENSIFVFLQAFVWRFFYFYNNAPKPKVKPKPQLM